MYTLYLYCKGSSISALALLDQISSLGESGQPSTKQRRIIDQIRQHPWWKWLAQYQVKMEEQQSNGGHNLSPEQIIAAIMQQMAENNTTTQQALQHIMQQANNNNNNNAQHQAAAPRPKERLPHLSEFDGTRSKFLCWEMEARNKLATDGATIGTNKDQLHYVFACLRGTAGNMCLAFTKAEEDKEDGSGEKLINYLASIYGNPFKQQAALDNLRSIQQGNQPFWKFLPKFETQLADAGALGFDDAIKISYLRGALNRTMREKLAGIFPTPKEYGPYTNLLHEIGSQLDLLTQEDKSAARKTNYLPQQQDTNAMDWEPTTPVKHTKAEVIPNKKQAKWVSQEEIKKRRENRCCIRCGKDNHYVRNCSFLPAKRPANLRSNQTVVKDEEEEVSDSEQEKE